MPTQRSWRGTKAHLEVREWLGGPRGDQSGVGRPTRWSEKGWEAHPEGRERSEAHSEVPEGLGGPP